MGGIELISILKERNKGEADRSFIQSIHRTLYLKNNIDFRMCSKNGNSTIKYSLSEFLTGIRQNYNTSQRKADYNREWDNGNIDVFSPFQFRKGSERVCVKRDPVDRALSGAKYVFENYGLTPDPSIDQLVEFLDNFTPDVDHHLYGQGYWLGDSSYYDRVIPLRQLDDFLKELEIVYNMHPLTSTKTNVSSSKVSIGDLPQSTIDRIQNLYEEDYKRGWF